MIFPPKFDCPHFDNNFASWIEHFEDKNLHQVCISCNSIPKKPWLCISCGKVFCLEEDHMDQHCEEASHPISLNIPDRNFWCFICKSYVVNDGILNVKRKLFHGPPAFTKDELIQGLRNNEYKRIAVLTGAGISVAAGIPDFRSPGTGLYSKLTDLGLPFAEAVFQLDFFRTNPKPFYEVARSFLIPTNGKLKPTYAHKFIKYLDSKGLLMVNFTQNIDGLELTAGLSSQNLVQAHGHMRTAHCIDCKSEFNMDEFLQHLENDQIFYCNNCSEARNAAENDSPSEPLKGLVKPDIVFFGESLPEDFKNRKDEMENADLVIVMGTSLQVYPFAGLVSAAPSSVPVVLINRDNPGVDRDRFLFLSGDIQETLQSLMKEIDKNIAIS